MSQYEFTKLFSYIEKRLTDMNDQIHAIVTKKCMPVISISTDDQTKQIIIS